MSAFVLMTVRGRLLFAAKVMSFLVLLTSSALKCVPSHFFTLAFFSALDSFPTTCNTNSIGSVLEIKSEFCALLHSGRQSVKNGSVLCFKAN